MDLLPRLKVSLGLVRRFMRYRFIAWRAAVGVHGRRGCHDVPADKASRAVRQGLYSLFAAGGPNIRENNPSRERCTYSKLNPPQSDEASVTSPKKCNYAT